MMMAVHSHHGNLVDQIPDVLLSIERTHHDFGGGDLVLSHMSRIAINPWFIAKDFYAVAIVLARCHENWLLYILAYHDMMLESISHRHIADRSRSSLLRLRSVFDMLRLLF